MPLCIFEGCISGSRSKKYVKNNTIHLHKFPKDVNLRAKWVSQIKNGSNVQKVNCDTAVVCSKHCAKSDIIEKTELQKAAGYSPQRARRLNEHAIPLSIFGLPYSCSPNLVSKTPVKVLTPSGAFTITEDVNGESQPESNRECCRNLFNVSKSTDMVALNDEDISVENILGSPNLANRTPVKVLTPSSTFIITEDVNGESQPG